MEDDMNRTTRGTVIALGVAALFSAGTALAEPAGDGHDTHDGKKDAKVACTGVNECKGKGECAGAGNSCAGSNSCKGKGVSMMSADDCQKKGGKVAAN
jgi:hypothetical protein